MTDASIETSGLDNLNRVARHKDGSADWSLSIGARRGIEKALPGNRIAVCFGIEGSELVDVDLVRLENDGEQLKRKNLCKTLNLGSASLELE
jgi:hypothetical protein